nr:MAG: polyprotein 2 [Picornavirales sp.]
MSTELTQISEVEGLVLDSQSTRNVKDDPYPDKTPSAILEREYLVDTFTISTNSQKFVSPINLLLQIPTVKAYLRNFRYLRTDFKLRIQMITTPMQFGSLGVSWLPYTDLLRDISLTAQSQSSMHLLDVGQQESLEISLPYLRPQLYYDLKDGTQQDWRVGFHGFVVDTITVGSPSSVIVNVFASMLNPEAAGYVPASGVFQSKMSSFNTAFNVAAAGTIAASMFGGRFSGDLPSSSGGRVYDVDPVPFDHDSPVDNAKLSLLGDISTPGVHASTTCSRLGDSTVALRRRSSTSMDIYSLGEIAQVPVHTDTFALSSTVPKSLQLSPFPVMAHSTYLRDMFKYFRGGSKILLKFLCSPLTSARVIINLYTTGDVTSVDSSIGDVMSWVLSVKGSQDWCVEIPYLQKRSWMSTSMQDYVKPVLTVSLLDPLPQPYDKPVALYCIAFQSAGSDLCLAGLESFVPRTDDAEEGTFQSVSGSMAKAEKLGVSSRHPYQGRDLTTLSIAGRFGSRSGSPSNLFPFPLEITSWTQSYQLDNFDYVAQLYAFYTGDTHIKMLFSAAPAGGNLNVVFGNSKTSVLGDKFKAGNSMVVSHQGVWPAVEFTFPYMCEDEFNSIRYPVGMYPQDYDWSATVSAYLIAATKDFSLHYLMPVPEFFRSARPVGSNPPAEEGVFQSRISQQTVYCTRMQSAVGQSNPNPIVFATDPRFASGTFTLDVHVVMTRLTGNEDCITHVHVGKSTGSVTSQPLPNSTTAYPQSLIVLPIAWIDSSNSGKSYSEAHMVKSFSAPLGNADLTVGYAQSVSASTYRYDVIVTVTPWHVANFLLNATNTNPEGRVTSQSTIMGTANVSVINTPSVSVANPVSQPVPVALQGTPNVLARIQGVLEPDTPVWTTSYK